MKESRTAFELHESQPGLGNARSSSVGSIRSVADDRSHRKIDQPCSVQLFSYQPGYTGLLHVASVALLIHSVTATVKQARVRTNEEIRHPALAMPLVPTRYQPRVSVTQPRRFDVRRY